MPKKNTTLPKLLTIRQAAEVLNVHVETLRRWDKGGKLKAVRLGKGYRIPQKSLDQFVKENQTL